MEQERDTMRGGDGKISGVRVERGLKDSGPVEAKNSHTQKRHERGGVVPPPTPVFPSSSFHLQLQG